MSDYWRSLATTKSRYWLERSWQPYLGGRLGRRCWVMLNPSTATDTQNDPTIRRCIRFSQRDLYSGLVVVNLWPLRSTDPGALVKYDPTPDVLALADRCILDAAEACDDVVCGWGDHGALRGRGSFVLTLLRKAGHQPLCLGQTRTGEPLHPLYVPGDRELVEVSP